MSKSFDFHVHARRKIEFHERIHRVRRGLENIDQALVRAHFKLLTRFLVHVRRTQHRPTIDGGRQWNRPSNISSGTLRGVHNFLGGLVENSVIVRLEAYTDFVALSHKLFDDLRDRACAHGVAAFANGEAQTLFESYWGDECDFAADVVAGHHHLDAGRQLHVAGDVRGAEVKLRTVASEKRGVAPAFFLGQHVRFSLELGVWRDRTGLANYLAALHIFFFRAAQQESNVIARQTFVQQLAKHFHAGNYFLLRGAETDDFDFFANFYLAALYSPGYYRAAAGDGENIFNRHGKRLINVAHRLRHILVHRFHQLVDSLFVLGVAVQSLQRRTTNDGNAVAGELVALQEFANFQLHQFEQFRVFHHVAFVQEHHNGGHADLASQENVLARLWHGAVCRRNYQNRAIHLRRAGDHVLDVVRVARAIHVRVVTVLRFILHVRNGNGDAPLALFRRVIDGVKRAELHLGIVLRQHLGDGRRQSSFAVINVTNGPNVHVRLITFEFLLRHLFLSSSNQSRFCCHYKSRILNPSYPRVLLPLFLSIISCAIELGASA